MANTFGGEMRLRGSSGQAHILRAAVTMNPATTSSEAVRNQNGTNAYSYTPRAPSCELTLEDAGENFDDILRAGDQDIYIVEDFNNVSHVFVSGRITGDAQIDRSTGAVTGLMIQSDDYRRITG
ncbi:hypothetical protein [Jiella marina]|uniref:hypothetical protein n=1 Tax=Jiella sp. LLJ827 TaxID=2917712 RepID=UPI002100C80E|nr:hypothetical protein [Jiella sp. LLJ827]MCQ0986402.1 hypothetical protein [Jiella sp. LLJ827]